MTQSNPSPLDESRSVLATALREAGARLGIPAELLIGPDADPSVDIWAQDLETGVPRAPVAAPHGTAQASWLDLMVWMATQDWRVHRRDVSTMSKTSESNQHGHFLEVRPPWIPETDRERTYREGRLAAMRWVAGAVAADETGRDVSEPPPEFVTVHQLLDQRIWWRCRDDAQPVPASNDQPFTQPAGTQTVPVRLSAMEHEHRVRLLGWLRQRATGLKTRAEWALLASITGPLGPRGDMAVEACDREMAQLQEETALHWLHRQPLVQELLRRTGVPTDAEDEDSLPGDDRDPEDWSADDFRFEEQGVSGYGLQD